jgi:hypothetical protein
VGTPSAKEVGDSGGYIPSWSNGPKPPQFTSHETACILNAPEEEAHVEITIYFSHREPVSLFAHSSVSRSRAPDR